MSEILDSGNRRTFETGAERDIQEGKGRFDLLPMCVLMRLAKHYEKGAIKYKERNWEKGIPAHSFADSAMRHLVKYLDGWTDEDHLIAAIWNLMGLAWTEEKKPEMMDIVARCEDKPFTITYSTTRTEEPIYLNNDSHSYCQDCNYKGLTECKLCVNGDRHSEMR